MVLDVATPVEQLCTLVISDPDQIMRPGLWHSTGQARSRWVTLALMASSVLVSRPGRGAPLPTATGTRLTTEGSHFLLNGRPTFLLGFSYYGALGASEQIIRHDLNTLRSRGFNWLRVWATWGAYATNVSAVTTDGLPREPYLTRLKWLIAECDRLGMAVDVTLSRGKELPGLSGHLTAVKTLTNFLQPLRNWYLDLGNERDVRDARHVSLAELKKLRKEVQTLDPLRLVTASFGGHDLSLADVRSALDELDLLCPHRPRHAKSPSETEFETRRVLDLMREIGHQVPLHYQEPFRRGYSSWEPKAQDFLEDLRGALRGGAAGWCFHNGAQRTQPDEQPRRGFDLRAKSLWEQLDGEEVKVVNGIKAVLAEDRRF